MKEELLKELISDTRPEDVSERYREVVDLIGVENFVKLGDYAKGDELYFPKVENIVSPARNRRIKEEFKSGSSDKVLAKRYNLTIKQIWNVLKDEPPQGQMTVEDWLKNGNAAE